MEILNGEYELQLVHLIYALADRGGEETAEPLDWMQVNTPSHFYYMNREYVYNWYSHYRGTREFVTWLR